MREIWVEVRGMGWECRCRKSAWECTIWVEMQKLWGIGLLCRESRWKLNYSSRNDTE